MGEHSLRRRGDSKTNQSIYARSIATGKTVFPLQAKALEVFSIQYLATLRWRVYSFYDTRPG